MRWETCTADGRSGGVAIIKALRGQSLPRDPPQQTVRQELAFAPLDFDLALV